MNIIRCDSIEDAIEKIKNNHNVIFVHTSSDIGMFDGYLGLTIAKVFNHLGTGFIKQSELLQISNDCFYLDAIAEQEHFQEDIMNLLLHKQTLALTYLAPDELNVLSNLVAECPYNQFMREYGRHAHMSADCTYIRLGNFIIYRGDNNKVPSDDRLVNIAFDEWFDDISYEEFNTLWNNKKYRLLVKLLRRHPGGNHEWFMCSQTHTAKRFGISAKHLNTFVTPTNECGIIYNGKKGWHGGPGSTTMHNELSDKCESANDAHGFLEGIKSIIQDYLIGANKADLLERLDALMA